MTVLTQTQLNAGEQVPQNQTGAAITDFTDALTTAKARAVLVRRNAVSTNASDEDVRRIIQDARANPDSEAHQNLFGFTVRSSFGQRTIETQDSDDKVTVGRLPDGHASVQVEGFLPSDDIEADGIRARNGNDKIKVYDKADRGFTIEGGAGNDVVGFTIEGGAGNDVIEGSGSNDRISGGMGDDVMTTSGGKDEVEDDLGANTVYAENGDDVNVNGESSLVPVTPPVKAHGHFITIHGDERFQSGQAGYNERKALPGLD